MSLPWATPPELETGRFTNATKSQLKKRGHQFSEGAQTSGLHGILIKDSGLEGAADPRRGAGVGVLMRFFD